MIAKNWGNDANVFDEPVGLLRTGTVKGYNPKTGKIQVQLHYAPSMSANPMISIPVPHAMFYNNGIFIGTLPDPETPIVVGQGSGNQWYFVSYLAENSDYVPKLEAGKLLISSNDITKITLDDKNNIYVGSNKNKMHISTSENLFSMNFQDEYHFTQAARHINGLIKRDLRINDTISQALKLESDIYNSQYYVIGMDPKTSINISSGSAKNPPFVERRNIVYEFQYEANVSDDLFESQLYTDKDPPPPDYNFINRRSSRADTLSLTLAAPNYLMETVQGTVVDIFGNILDINRVPIPIGVDQNTINAEKSTDKVQSFLSIKALERKSIAYHFELNARKDLSGDNVKTTNTNILALLDIDSNSDYARNRSRFFIDIDKEGQFKINVPASSETGNVPLLARYENYSTFGTDNPNKLEYRDDNLDIFLDSFAAPYIPRNSNESIPIDSTNRGSISIMDGDANATPMDRITGSPIKHGTVYHDILNTCYAHSQYMFLDYQNDDPPIAIDIKEITELNNSEAGSDLNNIVTKTIKTSGDDANAGGRSGSINLDGSLELNIGANTIDRQSLWLDTAGGIVSNIGRDRKNRSLISSLDGDVFIQVGGTGVSTDSRFSTLNNSYRGATFDIRVMVDGLFAHMIRVDKNGIEIMTPSTIRIHAAQGMQLTSGADISIEAENLTLQGRTVKKGFVDPKTGQPIGNTSI
jgi:hypothetical protein